MPHRKDKLFNKGSNDYSYLLYFTRLRFEGEASANLVGRAGRRDVVQLLGVNSKTERALDTRTQRLSVPKGEDAGVVNLRLNEGGRVKVGLGTDFEINTSGGSLGIIDSLGTGLDIRANTVVVASSES